MTTKDELKHYLETIGFNASAIKELADEMLGIIGDEHIDDNICKVVIDVLPNSGGYVPLAKIQLFMKLQKALLQHRIVEGGKK